MSARRTRFLFSSSSLIPIAFDPRTDASASGGEHLLLVPRTVLSDTQDLLLYQEFEELARSNSFELASTLANESSNEYLYCLRIGDPAVLRLSIPFSL